MNCLQTFGQTTLKGSDHLGDNIQKDLKELGWEGMIWIHVVQNGH
jgi:hypothetical protein